MIRKKMCTCRKQWFDWSWPCEQLDALSLFNPLSKMQKKRRKINGPIPSSPPPEELRDPQGRLRHPGVTNLLWMVRYYSRMVRYYKRVSPLDRRRFSFQNNMRIKSFKIYIKYTLSFIHLSYIFIFLSNNLNWFDV